MLFDMLKHRNEWWVPGKIVDIRQRLAPVWRAPGGPRDVLLLDIALDSYFRLCIERTDKDGLNGDSLVDLVTLVLRNASIAVSKMWGIQQQYRKHYHCHHQQQQLHERM